jgi:type I restriction enzyme S subunit
VTLNLDRSDWKRFSLGEIARASKEKVDPADGSVNRFVAGEHMDTDDLKLHRWGDVGEVDLGPAFHRRFRPGQVLYGSRRTYLRKVAVADFDGVCANTTFVVDTRDEGVLLQQFLPFIMCSEPFHTFAIAESKGSVNPYVNWSDIERYEFDLPSLDEQKRLADLLWAVAHHRNAIASLPGELGRGYDIWLECRLADVPTAPLEEVLQLQNGRPVASSLYGKGEFPLLRPGDMNADGSVRWSSTSVSIPQEFADQYRDWVLGPGDLVINMTAQTLDDRFLGRVCRMHDRALLNQRIGRLTGDDRVSEDFVFVALRSAQFADWVARKSEGSKVKHMHWRHITDYPMPVPSPDEQAAIVAEADSWAFGRRQLTTEASALTELRMAMLTEIFGAN